ncbi:MAG TPA: hypothetical protein VGT41_02070 [Candidatus Babeliales bacterium]|nr:hypothetical protein [Candidatus Babeliales bacterium]
MEREKTFVQELCEILVRHNVLSTDDITKVHESFEESSITEFDNFLIDEGLVDREYVLAALSEYYHVPYFDMEGFFFNSFLLHKFPKDFLLRHLIIPLSVDDDILIMVAANPNYPGLESLCRTYVSYDVNFWVGIGTDVIGTVEEYYDESLTEVDIHADDPMYERHEQDEYRALLTETDEEDEL